MSIEVGGSFGKQTVWRDKSERWHKDCVGAMKKQGETIMCWGMIGYGWKRPFFVWDPESDEEKKIAEREIARINAEMKAEAEEKEREWRATPEFAELKDRELAAARIQRDAEKFHGAPKMKTTQSWRANKFKVQKIVRNKKLAVWILTGMLTKLLYRSCGPKPVANWSGIQTSYSWRMERQRTLQITHRWRERSVVCCPDSLRTPLICLQLKAQLPFAPR